MSEATQGDTPRTPPPSERRAASEPAVPEHAKLCHPEGRKAREAHAEWHDALEQSAVWQAVCAETPQAAPWEADEERLQAPYDAHPVQAQRKAQLASRLLDAAGYRNTLNLHHPPTVTLTPQEGSE